MPFWRSKRKPKPPKKDFDPGKVFTNNTEAAARKTTIFRRLHRKLVKK